MRENHRGQSYEDRFGEVLRDRFLGDDTPILPLPSSKGWMTRNTNGLCRLW
jgi:hypothetical protein